MALNGALDFREELGAMTIGVSEKTAKSLQVVLVRREPPYEFLLLVGRKVDGDRAHSPESRARRGCVPLGESGETLGPLS